MTSATALVPAKINLQLAVGEPDARGYHPVASVYHAVSLASTVTVTPADHTALAYLPGPVDTASLDTGPDNLALRALAALPGARPARIEIVKRIPIAAGLAGGSADAAGVLAAANVLRDEPLPAGRLARVAAGLGADVAFSLVGGTALGTGYGERLAPVAEHRALDWVLVLDDGGLSTPRIYGDLDRLRAAGELPPPPAGLLEHPEASPVLAALASGDLDALADAIRNDLEPVAVRAHPRLAGTLDAVREAGALRAFVSGSGPTVVGLVASPEHAQRVRDRLAGQGFTAIAATGPEPVRTRARERGR